MDTRIESTEPFHFTMERRRETLMKAGWVMDNNGDWNHAAPRTSITKISKWEVIDASPEGWNWIVKNFV